jgi:hypothetical protein
MGKGIRVICCNIIAGERKVQDFVAKINVDAAGKENRVISLFFFAGIIGDAAGEESRRLCC